jgi:uncharacterized membrane protein
MRPKLKIKLDIYDKTLELLAFSAFIWLIWLVFRYYPDLPERIPTHYDIQGKADAYSSKSSFFILPLVGSVIYTGLLILNRFPHIFNYPKAITAENARRQYTLATKLVRGLNFINITGFAFFTYYEILTALGSVSGIPVTVIYLYLASIAGILVMYIMKMMEK